MSGFRFLSLTVNLCVPLKHVVVSGLSGLSRFFHGVVSGLLQGDGLSKFTAALCAFGGLLGSLQGLSLGAEFFHFLEVLPLVFPLVLALLEFSLEALHGAGEGLNGVWANGAASAIKLLRLFWLVGSHGFLGFTDDLVGFLALSLLLADHLVHLVAEVALFSHLDDQLSDFVVEFISGGGVLLGFVIPIVSNFTVLGRFLVNHFASFIEKIFEFCHASSHLVWGGFPSSRMLATHLPHLILHGRLVRCFPRHHAGHWSSLMVRRTRPRLERRSHFTAKVRGETGERMRYPLSMTSVVVASLADDCTNVRQRSISSLPADGPVANTTKPSRSTR